jgi:biotin carboxylase
MKNIFILGGSKLQLDLIYEAKKLYFNVHLFDGNNECIGKKYADYFYNIDIKDKETILAHALDIKPSAVLTIATEIGNVVSCYISEKLHLNSNSYETVLNTTDKTKMKKICQVHSINSAKYKLVEDGNYTWDIFPCIVKPSDSSAGRGVSYIGAKEDLKEAITKASNFSSNNKILIEEYIKGKQYSIETISSNKKHKIVTITEEYISNIPKIIETQQLVPARLNGFDKQKIEEFTYKVLAAFEISFGASHIEVRLDEKGELYFVEIASRMGGWRSELINLALGINYPQLLIFSHLGKDIEFKNTKDEYAIVKMILDKKDLEEYKSFEKNYSRNLISNLNLDEVYESKNLADSNGYYFLHIQNKDDLDKFIGVH